MVGKQFVDINEVMGRPLLVGALSLTVAAFQTFGRFFRNVWF